MNLRGLFVSWHNTRDSDYRNGLFQDLPGNVSRLSRRISRLAVNRPYDIHATNDTTEHRESLLVGIAISLPLISGQNAIPTSRDSRCSVVSLVAWMS